jgi:hypothetical protein
MIFSALIGNDYQKMQEVKKHLEKSIWISAAVCRFALAK